MYSFFLALHSLVRWLVLISLLIALYRAWRGLLLKKPFSKFDNTIRHTTATIAQTQMLLGIVLYCISPLVRYFLNYFKEAVHQRQIRFFGMELRNDFNIRVCFTGTVIGAPGSIGSIRHMSNARYRLCVGAVGT